MVDSHLHVFLLMGQSNMVGRDKNNGNKVSYEGMDNVWVYHSLNTTQEGNILVSNRTLLPVTSLSWLRATDPLFDINTDDKVGFSLGTAFALEYAKDNPSHQIAFLPLAVGGTALSLWEPGNILYEYTISMVRSIKEEKTIEGILWHQGESDAVSSELASSYYQRCLKMFQKLLLDLNQTDIPVIVGELGPFLRDNQIRFPFHMEINAALHTIAKERSNTSIVTCEGLEDKGDHLHFSAISTEELGRRYYAAFKNNKNTVSFA